MRASRRRCPRRRAALRLAGVVHAPAINTFRLGSDVAQLLGPWGLGLAGGTWGLGGALVVAGAVPLLGSAAFIARWRRRHDTR